MVTRMNNGLAIIYVWNTAMPEYEYSVQLWNEFLFA
jgi:hypothetical protein